MECENCRALLGASDISVIPKNKEMTDLMYLVICRSCDYTQKNKKVVVDVDGNFIVIST